MDSMEDIQKGRQLGVDDYLTKREPFREAHYKLINEVHGKGDLLLSGLFVEPTDEALLVFAGPTSKNAEEFVKTDPYVKNGMVKSWRIRKWVTSVGPGMTMP